MKFRGWVPTVSGRLSFSHIGDTNLKPPAISSTIADSAARYIICYQKRYLLDTIFPYVHQVSSSLFKLEGQMWFLFIATTENANRQKLERLRGRVYIFHNKAMWRGRTEKYVRMLQEYLSKFRFEHNQSLNSYFLTRYCRSLKFLEKRSSYWVECSISRSGTVEIRIPDGIKTSSKAPKFPDSGLPGLQHSVVSQVYYFIRDISHQHQHHYAQTDTILGIYEADANDIGWRREVLYSMYRKVIQYKRDSSEKILGSSLGVLSYARAFRRICQHELSLERYSAMPVYDEDALEKSIDAKRREIESRIHNRSQRSESFRSFTLTTLLIVLSVSSFSIVSRGAEIENTDPYILALSKYIVQYPIRVIFSWTLLLVVFMIISGLVNVAEWRILRWSVRIIQSFGQKTASFLSLFLGILLAVLTYFIVV